MFQYPSSGFNATAEYQVSGLPWVTSSIISGGQQIDFPMVTRRLTITNRAGGDVKIAFSQNGLNTNYITLSSTQVFNQDIRVAKIYLSGSASTVEVFANLTAINPSSCPVLTSSLYTGVG